MSHAPNFAVQTATLGVALHYLDRQGFFSWWQPTPEATLRDLREHGFDALDQVTLAEELAGLLGHPVPEWRDPGETLRAYAESA